MSHDSGFRQRGHMTSAAHKQTGRNKSPAAKRFEERSKRRFKKNHPDRPMDTTDTTDTTDKD